MTAGRVRAGPARRLPVVRPAAGTGQWVVVLGLALAVLLAFAWGCASSPAGRAVYATGSDAEAARLAGIRPDRRDVRRLPCARRADRPGRPAERGPVRGRRPQRRRRAGIAGASPPSSSAARPSPAGAGPSLGTLIGVALLSTIGPALVVPGRQPVWEKAIQGAIILLAVGVADALAGLSRATAPCSRAVRDSNAWTAARTSARSRRAAGGARWPCSGSTGTNFLTLGNAFEVLRLSVEIGLLAVALTPVIVTGGIDLSVGSLMGLSAVLFGMLWRDAGLPMPRRPRLHAGCRRRWAAGSTGC